MTVGWVIFRSFPAGADVCEPSRSVHYEGSWQRDHFSVLDSSVVLDPQSGHLTLRVGTGDDPFSGLVTAMDQEVRVTLVDVGIEASGHHLGYFLKSVAEKKGYVRGDGTLDRKTFVRAIDFTNPASYDNETFTYIWTCLDDEDQNGILNKPHGEGCLRSFPDAALSAVDFATSEEALAVVDDGTGLAFVPDGDGHLTPRDMTKSLGIIGEGQEIVFFLVPKGRFEDAYVSKASWNRDVYEGLEPCTTDFADDTGRRKFQLAQPAMEDGSCTPVSGWLSERALQRLREVLGLVFDPDQEVSLSLQTGKKFSHVVTASTPDVPGVRLMGWEDDVGGGDTDHNDLVFAVTIKAAGRVVSQDLSSARLWETHSFITSVDFEVTDRRAPCEGLKSGFVLDSGELSHADVRYAISVDNGTSWIPINRWDDIIDNADGSKTRRAHLDVLGLGRSGQALKWKAILETVNTRCDPPQIVDVRVDYTASNQGEFSRSDPVVLGNVLYSSGLEMTPDPQGRLDSFRGHLHAYLIYDPAHPSTPLFQPLWDAGQALAERSLKTEARRVLMALFDAVSVQEKITVPDGTSRHFSGVVNAANVLSGSLVFRAVSSAGLPLMLRDTGNGILAGDGIGTFNRSSGEYTLEFTHAPCEGCAVIAEYARAASSPVLRPFSAETTTALLLGLDDSKVHGVGFTWDLNGDGHYDQEDRQAVIRRILGFDNATQKRAWPLDGIDHSTPAVVGPPCLPPWYFGTQTVDEERDAYDAWRQSKAVAQRKTVAYVGSQGGMVHAFHAGRYRHGDDPSTIVKENRGYFEAHDYGDGAELWAFIPPSALSRLSSLLKPQPWILPPSVNASPCVQDVAVRTQTGVTFKTVLVSAQGVGGESVFALDVTDPDNPAFLWEYTDPILFRSRGAPAMARVGRLNDAGSPLWAVFVNSGQTGPLEPPSLFLLDAARGKPIRKVSLDFGESTRGSLLSGSPALVDTDGNGYVDRAYVADNNGHVIRVDFPDHGQMPWDAARIHVSLFVKVSASVYAAPVVYLAHRYKADGSIAEAHVKVMFGTGDDPARADSPNTPTGYRFYVFDDVCRMDWTEDTLRTPEGLPCSSQGMKAESDAEWVWALPSGHRIWAEAVAAAGRVYFGTAVSDTDDPCSPLQDKANKGGKVYAVDLSALNTLVDPVLVAETEGNVTGLFVEDEHLYARVISRDGGARVQIVGDGVFNNETALGTRFVTKKVKGSWHRFLEK
ncbi:PilC/PilY family type IV pilus protein [Desulfosoma caldarium]|nr:PilC/PilY family type IV pilus protein [Desulfosoma caldarium]